MTAPDTTDQAIAAAVIVRDGKVLLIRRRLREGSLLWALPSGGIEPGETEAQAAARETLEEVGLTVTASELLGERIHPTTGRRMLQVACNPNDGTPEILDKEEIAELIWASKSDLPKFVPSGFFEQVQRYLESQLT